MTTSSEVNNAANAGRRDTPTPASLNFDPGLTERYGGELQRAVNPDGQFNIRLLGRTWRDAHPYLYLINASWLKFLVLVGTAFIIANTLFALLYYAIGIEHLKGAEAPTASLRFVNAFFFSAHTLTTVGYGNMWPIGPLANAVAATEALAGVLVFAIATGLLFGRFSRPSARIGFSNHALIAPYGDGTSLQFRVVNRRSNNLIDVDARVVLMSIELSEGQPRRRFKQLKLERDGILFFALTWTVVHPIDSDSPLWGKSSSDLQREQAEILVLIRAYDDSFGQQVHQRSSYRYDQIVWGAAFQQAFDVDRAAGLQLDVGRVGAYEPAPIPERSGAAEIEASSR